MKKGWEIKTIGDVCKVIAGQSPEGKFYNNIGSGIPFYQGKKEYGEKYIGAPTTWTTKVTKEAEANDILMSVRAPVGPINIATQKICIGRGLAAIRPTKLINKEFLYSYLLKHESEIVGNAGAVFNSINKAQIEAIKIPLPPLPEQQRIVAILDEAFAAIAKAKANAEQNLKNVKELFESYLQGVFENGNWAEKKLSDLSDTGAGGTPLKSHKDYYQGGNVPWLRSGEVDKKDIFECELLITEKGLKNSSARLFPKDTVLIAMYGATAGQVGILRFECSTNQAVCGILPNKNIIPEFLYYKFMAGKQALVDQAVGGAQPNISQIKIKNTLVPFISLKEQQTIVKKLDALSAETKKLEAIYHQKISDLEELKKSVLQKAFSGELKTAQAFV